MSELSSFQKISPVLTRPRVLLYSKRTALAEGVAESLRNMAGAVVNVISNEAEIASMLQTDGFSVLLLDCGNSDHGLMVSIQPMLRTFPAVTVATLFDEVDSDLINTLLDRGVKGIMVTTAKLKTISAAIHLLDAGECYVTNEFRPAPAEHNKMADRIFSRREMGVLNGLTRGMTNRQIGDDQGLAVPTVKMYVRSIFRKLGVRNRLQAAVVARKVVPFAFENI